MNLRPRMYLLFVLLLALLAVSCAPVPQATETVEVAVVQPTTTPVPTVEPPVEAATPTTAPEPEVETPQAQSLRFEIVPEQSEARYRVREQLASLSLPNDAIGATKQISGSVTISSDGTIDPASQFVVDMSSLRTDSDRRDNFVRRNVLQTDQYPTAVFVPTRVSGLAFPLPPSGEVNFELTGDLTLRDVTREVTWQVSGTMDGEQAVGMATVRLSFEDFNITKPRVASVLSIEDHIDLEVDVVIRAVDGS
jgi:polyisoprenoid-binding protein YceI